MSLSDKIKQSGIVQTVIGVSKKIILPGFEGMPLYDVVKFFFSGLQNGYIDARASAMSFKFFMALFPFLIFLFTLIPYIPIDNFQIQLLELLHQVLPTDAYNLISDTIDGLILEKHTGLLSFSIIFTLYLSTNGVEAMLVAFNSSSHLVKFSNSVWQQKLRAFIILMVLIFTLIITVGAIIGTGIAVRYLKEQDLISKTWSIYLVNTLQIIILLSVYFLSISFIYYYGNLRSKKFRFISAGATFATVLSLILTFGFAYYVNNFGNYNKIYGSLGAMIVLMLWMYYNSIALLLGFELNASIRHASGNLKK